MAGDGSANPLAYRPLSEDVMHIKIVAEKFQQVRAELVTSLAEERSRSRVLEQRVEQALQAERLAARAAGDALALAKDYALLDRIVSRLRDDNARLKDEIQELKNRASVEATMAAARCAALERTAQEAQRAVEKEMQSAREQAREAREAAEREKKAVLDEFRKKGDEARLVHEEELAELQAELRSVREECAEEMNVAALEFEECNARLTDRIAVLEKDNANLQEEVAACNGHIAALEKIKRNLQVQVSASSGHIASLETDNRNLQEEVSASSGHIASLETDNRNVQEQLSASKEHIAALETGNRNLQEQVKMSSDRIAALETDNRNLQEQVLASCGHIEYLEVRMAELHRVQEAERNRLLEVNRSLMLQQQQHSLQQGSAARAVQHQKPRAPSGSGATAPRATQGFQSALTAYPQLSMARRQRGSAVAQQPEQVVDEAPLPPSPPAPAPKRRGGRRLFDSDMLVPALPERTSNPYTAVKTTVSATGRTPHALRTAPLTASARPPVFTGPTFTAASARPPVFTGPTFTTASARPPALTGPTVTTASVRPPLLADPPSTTTSARTSPSSGQASTAFHKPHATSAPSHLVTLDDTTSSTTSLAPAVTAPPVTPTSSRGRHFTFKKKVFGSFRSRAESPAPLFPGLGQYLPTASSDTPVLDTVTIDASPPRSESARQPNASVATPNRVAVSQSPPPSQLSTCESLLFSPPTPTPQSVTLVSHRSPSNHPKQTTFKVSKNTQALPAAAASVVAKVPAALQAAPRAPAALASAPASKLAPPAALLKYLAKVPASKLRWSVPPRAAPPAGPPLPAPPQTPGEDAAAAPTDTLESTRQFFRNQREQQREREALRERDSINPPALLGVVQHESAPASGNSHKGAAALLGVVQPESASASGNSHEAGTDTLAAYSKVLASENVQIDKPENTNVTHCSMGPLTGALAGAELQDPLKTGDTLAAALPLQEPVAEATATYLLGQDYTEEVPAAADIPNQQACDEAPQSFAKVPAPALPEMASVDDALAAKLPEQEPVGDPVAAAAPPEHETTVEAPAAAEPPQQESSSGAPVSAVPPELKPSDVSPLSAVLPKQEPSGGAAAASLQKERLDEPRTCTLTSQEQPLNKPNAPESVEDGHLAPPSSPGSDIFGSLEGESFDVSFTFDTTQATTIFGSPMSRASGVLPSSPGPCPDDAQASRAAGDETRPSGDNRTVDDHPILVCAQPLPTELTAHAPCPDAAASKSTSQDAVHSAPSMERTKYRSHDRTQPQGQEEVLLKEREQSLIAAVVEVPGDVKGSDTGISLPEESTTVQVDLAVPELPVHETDPEERAGSAQRVAESKASAEELSPAKHAAHESEDARVSRAASTSLTSMTCSPPATIPRAEVADGSPDQPCVPARHLLQPVLASPDCSDVRSTVTLLSQVEPTAEEPADDAPTSSTGGLLHAAVNSSDDGSISYSPLSEPDEGVEQGEETGAANVSFQEGREVCPHHDDQHVPDGSLSPQKPPPLDCVSVALERQGPDDDMDPGIKQQWPVLDADQKLTKVPGLKLLQDAYELGCSQTCSSTSATPIKAPPGSEGALKRRCSSSPNAATPPDATQSPAATRGSPTPAVPTPMRPKDARGRLKRRRLLLAFDAVEM